MKPKDSRLVYIVCHAMAFGYNGACAAALIWLALELRTAWVLLAMLVLGRAYKHDFKKNMVSNHSDGGEE